MRNGKITTLALVTVKEHFIIHCKNKTEREENQKGTQYDTMKKNRPILCTEISEGRPSDGEWNLLYRG